MPATKKKAKAKAPEHRRSFGNVRKLPSGRWQAWYRTNNERHLAPDTFSTKTAATTWLTTQSADRVRGVPLVNARAGLVPFRDFAEGWYLRRSRSVIKPLAETTKAKYRRLLDVYILPKFGDSKLSQITTGEVQDWWDDIARDHRSTAADAYRLLSTIYNAAIDPAKLLPVGSSPCTIDGAATMPVETRPTVKLEELQKAVDSTPERYRLGFLLAAWCGLRRGEVLGLRRRSVDLLDNSITISETWVAVPGGRPFLKSPKSKAGERKLYLPAQAAEAMTSHLDKFVGPETDAWLFGTSTGTAVSPRNLSRAWDKARAKAGRSDLHMHDLRHTGLTWAAHAGATRAELMHMGGHATDAAARRYQQAEDNRLRELAERMGQAANGGQR